VRNLNMANTSFSLLTFPNIFGREIYGGFFKGGEESWMLSSQETSTQGIESSGL